jgi:hypothetical protein
MPRIEERLCELGLSLPPPIRLPPGVVFPFQFVRIVGRCALGDLDRIAAWGRVFGMVDSAPGFNRQPTVINGFSDLILELFGAETGAHCRSAVGLAELPFDIPVEIEAEVELL